MKNVQTNVRVLPGDQPLLRTVAMRLRMEPHFRNRLKGLVEDYPTPVSEERVEKLEEEVGWLLSAAGRPRARFALSSVGIG
jgi:hypothetical protein